MHLYPAKAWNGWPRNIGQDEDAQINLFDHLDHLDETKDLAAKMIKWKGRRDEKGPGAPAGLGRAILFLP